MPGRRNNKPAKRRWSEYERVVIRSYLTETELMCQHAIAAQEERAASGDHPDAAPNIHWWRDAQRIIRWMLSQVRD